MLRRVTWRIVVCSFVAASPLAADVWGEDRPGAEYSLEENLVYARVGDKALLLDAFLPKSDGPHPAVIVIHGGAWRRGNKKRLRFFAKKLVEQGYAAFAINYRLAPEFKFPAQIEDCRDAFRFVVKHAKKYHVDSDRLAVMGYSAGGHLAVLLGVEGVSMSLPPDAAKGGAARVKILRPAAVIAGGAPCDFRLFPQNARTLAYWLGDARAKVPEIYKAASPAAFVTAAASPMFFFHGDRDALVSVKSPKRMVERLKEARVESKLFVVKGSGHILTLFNQEAHQQSIAFLDKLLKPTAKQAKD